MANSIEGERHWKRRPWQSIYWQLSVSYLSVLLICAAAYSFVFLRITQNVYDRTLQLENWQLASYVAGRLLPSAEGPADLPAIFRTLEEFHNSHPAFQLFILKADGSLSEFSDYSAGEFTRKVNPAVLEKFIADNEWNPDLHLIDHPTSSARVPFSAARLKIGQREGYLLIALRRNSVSPISIYNWGNRGMQEGAMVLAVVTLISALFGLLVFALLTRRFHELIGVVRRYQHADYSARATVGSANEIGELAYSVNLMAERIEDSIAQLKQKDELRRELVATISHDLRAPAGSITALAETLIVQRAQLSEAEIDRCLKGIFASGDSLATLVKELFQLSKIEAGEVVAVMQRCDVFEIADQARHRFSQAARDAMVELAIRAPDTLPEVVADPHLLSRVFDNLLSNALRFTPAAGTICISLELEGHAVKVAISDTGEGIAPEKLPRIFERFYRADEKGDGGLGLGLAIVSKLLSLQGSRITAESTLGKGTTFLFWITLYDPAAGAGAQSGRSPESTSS